MVPRGPAGTAPTPSGPTCRRRSREWPRGTRSGTRAGHPGAACRRAPGTAPRRWRPAPPGAARAASSSRCRRSPAARRSSARSSRWRSRRPRSPAGRPGRASAPRARSDATRWRRGTSRRSPRRSAAPPRPGRRPALRGSGASAASSRARARRRTCRQPCPGPWHDSVARAVARAPDRSRARAGTGSGSLRLGRERLDRLALVGEARERLLDLLLHFGRERRVVQLGRVALAVVRRPPEEVDQLLGLLTALHALQVLVDDQVGQRGDRVARFALGVERVGREDAALQLSGGRCDGFRDRVGRGLDELAGLVAHRTVRDLVLVGVVLLDVAERDLRALQHGRDALIALAALSDGPLDLLAVAARLL